MGLCLGFETSLQYWLTKGPYEALPEPAGSGALARAEASARSVAREQLPLEPSRERPVHLLVPDRSLGHAMSEAVAHVWRGELPAGSLCRLSGDNTIASPELTFVQMASRRTLAETIELGCYLCSTFSVDEDGRYAGERYALTSTEALAGFIALLPTRVHGVRRARRALEHVADGAASPKEIFLTMVYGLPPALGEKGPFAFQANQVIAIDPHIQRLLGSRYLKGDLYLPEFNADLEYDSYEFHTGKYRLDHTQARRNALEAMGTKTVSATYGQVRTFESFENFTWMFRERLGLDHPTYSREERAAQIALYEHLMGPENHLF